MQNSIITNREDWLIKASDLLRSLIIEPTIERLAIDTHQPTVAVSIGHPKSKRALGEAWHTSASDDSKTNHIFITPFENDSSRILDVLLHELIHAYDNLENGHKGRFALLAKACGLTGKMTATIASDELKEKLLDITDIIGDIPHHKLDESVINKPKQKGRMLKIECSECKLVLRASKTQVVRIAQNDSATCPCCNANTFNQSAIDALI